MNLYNPGPGYSLPDPCCIAVVDDDEIVTSLLYETLTNQKYLVQTYENAETALKTFQKTWPDLVLLDLRLPGMDGLEMLHKIKSIREDIPVIMMTGFADIDSAVRAVKLGAIDFITKPFNIVRLIKVIRNTLHEYYRGQMATQIATELPTGFGKFIGKSPAMNKIYNFIQDISISSNTTILITGETGTGKGLLAREIHSSSDRSLKPFVEINCSAIQKSLLESELFGYESGAFTSARKMKKGLVEIAHEGTIFLDEIGDLPLDLQAKLLKVLDEKKVRRLGGTEEHKVDVRIVSATSKDLILMVQENQFRRDLFYRLNVAEVYLPPFRDRAEDILLITDYFIAVYNKEFNKKISSFSNDYRDTLLNHLWPGNVRELKNTIERSVLFEKSNILHKDSLSLINMTRQEENREIMKDGKLVLGDLPDSGISLPDIEREILEKAMRKTDGNITRAAALVGISRDKMKYRIKKIRESKER